METIKFNWKLPLYGSIGFAVGPLIFIIWLFTRASTDNPIQEVFFGILMTAGVFAAWGLIGGLFLGFGLNNRISLRIAVAESIGAPISLFFASLMGQIAGGYFETFGMGTFIFVFAVFVCFLGLFLGFGTKNKNLAVQLAMLGFCLGAIVGIIVWFLEIKALSTLNFFEIVPFIVLAAGALTGLMLGFALSYLKFRPPPKIIPEVNLNKRYLSAIKFISASFLFGVVMAVLVIIFYPTEIIEPVCDYPYDCNAQIITKNQLYIDGGIYYVPVTHFRYVKDNKTFTTYWDKNMRLSLEWIRQNTEEDAKFLNWWDYGHIIRGYTGRETIAYAPSLEGYTRMFMGRELENENISYEEAERKAIDNWDTKTLGDFSPNEKIIDIGYALLTDNLNETLQIMDKYNLSYLYVHSQDAGKSRSICLAIDKYYTKMKGYSCLSVVELKQEDYMRYEELNYSELYSGMMFPDLFKNTAIGKALKNKGMEGLELVYRDKFSAIYQRV